MTELTFHHQTHTSRPPPPRLTLLLFNGSAFNSRDWLLGCVCSGHTFASYPIDTHLSVQSPGVKAKKTRSNQMISPGFICTWCEGHPLIVLPTTLSCSCLMDDLSKQIASRWASTIEAIQGTPGSNAHECLVADGRPPHITRLPWSPWDSVTPRYVAVPVTPRLHHCLCSDGCSSRDGLSRHTHSSGHLWNCHVWLNPPYCISS